MASHLGNFSSTRVADHKGMPSLLTSKDIARGEILFKFTGRLLTRNTGDRCLQVRSQTWLTPKEDEIEPPWVFLNHSFQPSVTLNISDPKICCDKNPRGESWIHDKNTAPVVTAVANTSLPANSPLTINYNFYEYEMYGNGFVCDESGREVRGFKHLSKDEKNECIRDCAYYLQEKHLSKDVDPFAVVASGDTEKLALLLNHLTQWFVHPTLPKTSQWKGGVSKGDIISLETYPQKTLDNLLQHAVWHKAPADMVDDLLSTGANPAAYSLDDFGINAVHISSHTQQADIMDMLLTDAHRTARGQSPEIPFRNAGRQVSVKNETSPLVDARRLSPDGVTALWEAAFNGDLDSCRVLLECGANPNLRREFVVFFLRTPSSRS